MSSAVRKSGNHHQLQTRPRVRQSPSECRYQVVAVGASAGGFNSLFKLLKPLPEGLPVALLVVLHLSPDHRSLMPQLLMRHTALKVHEACDGEAILPGVVYTAPPNLHLLAEPGNVRLLRAPPVHYSRPSIDLLFESVAVSYGSRAVAVVLNGSGADGASGLRAVKMAGGLTMVEDPAKAEFASMPYSAIATGCVDMVLPLEKIAPALLELCEVKLNAGR